MGACHGRWIQIFAPKLYLNLKWSFNWQKSHIMQMGSSFENQCKWWNCIFKAKLVAKGYSQQHGIDYNEIFLAIVKFDSIRTILAICYS